MREEPRFTPAQKAIWLNVMLLLKGKLLINEQTKQVAGLKNNCILQMVWKEAQIYVNLVKTLEERMENELNKFYGNLI